LCGAYTRADVDRCPDCSRTSVQAHIAAILESALKTLSDDVASAQDKGKLYFKMGNFLRLSGKYDDAVPYYKKALESLPKNPEILRCLGSTYAGMHQYAEAEHYMRKGAHLAREYADYHNDLGAALYKNKKYNEAIVSLREALRINPRFANAHNNLALALRKLGRHDEAEAEILRAIELDPEHAVADYSLGQAYFRGGMFSQLKERLQMDAKSLGDVYFLQKDYKNAVEQYEKAVNIHPGYADYHFALGSAYENNGKAREAAVSYNKALKINPLYAEVSARLKTVEGE
jgi:tetratricopeptide (TPR) repeat protein